MRNKPGLNLVQGTSFCLLILGFVLSLWSCGTPERTVAGPEIGEETPEQRDARMAWWREARFGLFIHWGLYAVPAGEWKDRTDYGEWIRHTARIPLEVYDGFAPRFNPVRFDAAEWVRTAREAGMRYIVITSKHHDGFCLFDSALTDFDIMDATPFKRDILKELAAECKRQGVRLCFYHSIMDWHHPDYLPRREWEREDRSEAGADFDRYVATMKGQVRELLTNYGDIGVLWFDGEWESTWTPERGEDLFRMVRALRPSVIVNNRVSSGREGMAGTFDPGRFPGDFGTPEQEIPATGLGYDWETCMTMNRNWGYNKNDRDWKSSAEIVRMLVDIASKGGNFLLNVGPTAEGLFPQPSLERLAEVGRWMKVNGESIYGTTASLFSGLPWGRSTTKPGKIYLHVFDWPQDGMLHLPALEEVRIRSASFLAAPERKLEWVDRPEGSSLILPAEPPDPVVSVVVLELERRP